MIKKLIFPILTLLWMALIFYFSSRTADDSGVQSMFITERIIRWFISNPSDDLLFLTEVFVRKAAHFTEYFVLGGLVYGSLKSCLNMKSNKSLVICTILVCVFYALSDEIHQYFVPGRACRAFDIFVDTSGSVFFILIYTLFSKVKRV